MPKPSCVRSGTRRRAQHHFAAQCCRLSVVHPHFLERRSNFRRSELTARSQLNGTTSTWSKTALDRFLWVANGDAVSYRMANAPRNIGQCWSWALT